MDRKSPLATLAEGRVQKLVLLLLGLALVIGIGSWYPPFAQGYEVKNAMKLACNDVIRKYKGWRDDWLNQGTEWKDVFVRRAGGAGVRLQEKQYSFRPSHDAQAGEFVCKAKVTYPTKMEWFLISDFFTVEPVLGTKKIEFEHRILDKW